MTRSKAVAQKSPTLAPERAWKALRRQLEDLEKLKNRNYQEADTDETEWMHLTENIIEGAFGKPSTNLSKFYSARSAGYHNLFGISPQQRQNNFELRIKKYGALLRSLIDTLYLQLPEKEIKGVYEPGGDEYAFYRDLSSLVATVKNDIFIVDAYLNEQVFNLYVSKVPDAADVRILSNNIGPNVVIVAEKYAKSHQLKLRSSGSIHDRMLFLDQRGWVTGQSIKDAAQKKPTYLIELNEPLLTAAREAHDKIWKQARDII